MRQSYGFALLISGIVMGGAAIAQQAPTASHAAHKPATASPTSYRAVATVQDLMAEVIDPSSKVVFGAVSSQTTATGTVETAPKSDAEWNVVRHNALMMVEGANLLLIPGRHMAKPENMHKANEGELPPAEIEVRVGYDRAAWNRFAIAFRDAAVGALKAAEAHRKDDFGPVSEAIDMACENCHLRFWYPDQEQLLKNAPKPK